MKKLLATSLVVAALSLAGCSDIPKDTQQMGTSQIPLEQQCSTLVDKVRDECQKQNDTTDFDLKLKCGQYTQNAKDRIDKINIEEHKKGEDRVYSYVLTASGYSKKLKTCISVISYTSYYAADNISTTVIFTDELKGEQIDFFDTAHTNDAKIREEHNKKREAAIKEFELL